MNEQTDQLDRAEEELLAHAVSDEALEAAGEEMAAKTRSGPCAHTVTVSG
jgi:hypothetical protein